jgi:HAD superfamily 5'-nucleotidase-like hydrolase
MSAVERSKEPPRRRRVFANRTLNLGAIKAIGCDMDYTLIHYHHALWEQRAYDHIQRRMLDAGFPVADLRFDPDLVVRGLILDLSLGNVVKANRFGYVTRATHGTRTLDHAEQRRLYSRVLVDLSDSRWVFLNTLFSLSEACLYAQLVDLMDDGKLPTTLGYRDAYELVRAHTNLAHTVALRRSKPLAGCAGPVHPLCVPLPAPAARSNRALPARASAPVDLSRPGRRRPRWPGAAGFCAP